MSVYDALELQRESLDFASQLTYERAEPIAAPVAPPVAPPLRMLHSR